MYSFGVLVLEVMSGRRALELSDPSGVVLITDWAWTHAKAGRPGDVLAEALRKEPSTSVAAMERYVLVGILCAHVTVAFRPSMPEALRMLEGDMDVPTLSDRCVYSSSNAATHRSTRHAATELSKGSYGENNITMEENTTMEEKQEDWLGTQ